MSTSRKRVYYPKLGDPLTDTERRVYDLICQRGITNTEIAKLLGSNTRAIKFHVANILVKHGVDTRTKMIVDYWKFRARLSEVRHG